MRSENEKQKQKQVTKEICECEIIPCTNVTGFGKIDLNAASKVF